MCFLANKSKYESTGKEREIVCYNCVSKDKLLNAKMYYNMISILTVANISYCKYFATALHSLLFHVTMFDLCDKIFRSRLHLQRCLTDSLWTPDHPGDQNITWEGCFGLEAVSNPPPKHSCYYLATTQKSRFTMFLQGEKKKITSF